MRRIVAAVFAALVALAPVCALAQGGGAAGFAPNVTFEPAISSGPVAAGQAMAQVSPDGKVAIVGVPAPAPNTVVSFGTIGAELLGWMAAVLVPVLGTFATKWLMALAKKAGVEASQAMSDKLDGIIERGLRAAADKAGAAIEGKLNVDVKNKVVADAVKYAQDHAADTIKDLGGPDVNDPKVVEALRARAAQTLAAISPPAAPKA